MTTSLSPIFVRIYTADHKVVGAGFLVLERHILTCAHVINRATGLPPSNQKQAPGEVELDFPLLPSNEITSAAITLWDPEHDIALLSLSQAPPPGASPARLLTPSRPLWGHHFRAYGFPQFHDQGIYSEGKILAQLDSNSGWVQIESNSHYRVQPGFSGGPLWDETLQGVVGMVGAAEADESIKAAFFIPTSVLLKVWPDLPTQQTRPKKNVPFVLPQKEIPTFTGRHAELDALAQTLLPPRESPPVGVLNQSHPTRISSIVGLAGAGGIGKSALACQFASHYRDHFPAGVIGLRVDNKDPDSIARSLIRTLGLTLAEDDERDAATLMQEYLTPRRLLLIFDNAEQADDLRHLLPGGQHCAVIITTRDKGLPLQLDIPGHTIIDLPPLPDAEAYILLEKFIGPTHLEPEKSAAQQIIRLVGNLPLALEIVGKTLQLRPRLSSSDYAASLRDEHKRLSQLQIRRDPHLNIRLTFNKSIELLTQEGESDLIDFFACLSVCAERGFALATALATSATEAIIAADFMAYLVQLSLLNEPQDALQAQESPRFIFHPLLRNFAADLARERNLYAAAQKRHAAHFRHLIKTTSITDPTLATDLATNLDDILLAATWIQEQQQADYTFALKLQPFFLQYGYWQQAGELMTTFLTLAEQLADWHTAIQFRLQQAKYASLRGDFTAARLALQPIPDLITHLDPASQQARDQAMYFNSLGGVQQRLGRFEDALASFEQSYALLVTLEDQRGQAMVLNSLADTLRRQDRFEEALAAYQQCLAIEVELGNQRGQEIVLTSMAGLQWRTGHFEAALTTLQRSLELATALNNQRGQSMIYTEQARIYIAQKAFEPALEALQHSFDLSLTKRGKRGLGIVVPLMAKVLTCLNRAEEIGGYCQRALKVAPKDKKLLKLKTQLTGPPKKTTPLITLSGHIKRIIHHPRGYRYGFITPDDGSADIYFKEPQIEIGPLSPGMQVEADVMQQSHGRIAQAIRIKK